jgi:hypothetical protein
VRFAAAAAAILLLAGCGAGSKARDAGTGRHAAQSRRASFDRHLRQDGLVLYHASAALRPPASKSIPAWLAELHATQPRVHAARVDLATVRAPSSARGDRRAILGGFRFTDRLLTRLTRDLERRDRAAFLHDASSMRRGRTQVIFGRFNAAVRDLLRKGYEVGVLSR